MLNPAPAREADTPPRADAHPTGLLGRCFGTARAGRAHRLGHQMRWADGSATPLEVARWLGDPSPDEVALLRLAVAPVLDVGCGPGRHVAALSGRGLRALGIDVLPEAVLAARTRGAVALERSVFDRVPDEGGWATVLLLDGNIGIGGDPGALIRRVRDLVHDEGRLLVEVERPGVGVRSETGYLETPHGRSRAFTWGRVGVDALDGLAAGAGFEVVRAWRAGDRWFARLDAR